MFDYKEIVERVKAYDTENPDHIKHRLRTIFWETNNFLVTLRKLHVLNYTEFIRIRSAFGNLL